jgi:anti-anti-sigma factor
MRTAFAGNDVGELEVFAETDEIAVLCLEGEFDLANAPQIIERGERLLADDKQLILDLSDATFIDASVIDALSRLGAHASKNGRTVVLQLGTAPIVERVIRICNIDRVLPRAHTRPEAIDMIRQLQRPAA